MKNHVPKPLLMGGAPGPETIINGRKCVYFGGTGYFALQGHAAVLRAAAAALKKYGMHPAASRSGFGNNPVLLAAEQRIAEYFGTEASLYFASAYLSGLFMAQGLADRFDAAFADETSHFSVLDGVYAARKPVILYKHRDAGDLGVKLKTGLKRGQRPLVITDGVFPAYGAIAPVPELLKALAPYEGVLCVDDAHGVGVLGARGRGTLEHFGLKPAGNILMSGTLSKAFGGYGGFIPASSEFVQKIKLSVGAYGGASAIPTPMAAGSAKGLELLRRHPEWRKKLRHNVARVKKGLRALGLDAGDTPVPIVTWTLDSAERMQRVQRQLLARGVAIAYLKYVGAPAGGVLRASVFSAHTDAHIDQLLRELKIIL
ncbi:MAG TPA: pyridoxal phosphate-dependent aminotransferase family protein [Elusimicrobiales bacterium]|nr:pyridoxal phosphate-dependent aminotransferase family protein [Elusimicrobiales bacterium]